ncbi:protein lifeguard 4-like [Anoplophora glabripennis]|uniref:protein lifeguard 4-like n=1 Tax=Anoplophora glabripennis TaxID=217634 RepID=UPI00087554C3|nr:protein lifeguard 4-like [Anoplophora glabripennis]XP_018567207.1 protein lifeguard 4-like [Anoplophora glabripennis]
MSQTIPLILEEDVEQGGKEYDEDIENDFAYRNNVAQATKSIRMAFIRKVYGLLTMQIFLTIVIASICMFTPPIKDFVHSNDWILMPTFLGSIALLLALHIKRRESPTNLILLAAFTIVQAYTIGVIVTFYSQAVVLQALLLTFVVLAGLTLYTFQTKRDFSAIHSALFAGLCILIIGGFMQVFLQSTIFEIAIGFSGALVFSLFIIFDTQLIMKTLSPEEYILATINLYMDIVNLFLYILRILQAVNRQ